VSGPTEDTWYEEGTVILEVAAGVRAEMREDNVDGNRGRTEIQEY
jgi:hypothetical protein